MVTQSGSPIKKIKVVRGGEDEDGNGVMCDICSQILKSAGSLARHMEAVHGDGGEKFICNDCGEIQDTARKLKSHRRKHKTFVCEKCIATDAQLLVAFFHITECLSCWL